MAIDNQIFEHYREEKKKIDEAKKLLEDNGYKVQLLKTKDIQQEIQRLRSQITGMMHKDVQTNKDIYRLQRMLQEENNKKHKNGN